ncbi:MAG: DUF1013 domain-containing protein [Alphaproteobacteria bacterium]|nr:DUF1013 domain-containing protein [Alphaproteobacteria bacterium]
MSLPLMPKATAVWLVENTSLSFEQISQFCGLHILEIQAMADGEVGIGLQGIDPVLNGQVSLAEIERCQAEPTATLTLLNNQLPEPSKMIGMRYTPISKRQDKPDAIAWFVKTWPDLSDGQIQKLIGTTKNTIQAVRNRTHWNATNIKPRHPVTLGLCSQAELEAVVGQREAARQAAETEKLMQNTGNANAAEDMSELDSAFRAYAASFTS